MSNRAATMIEDAPVELWRELFEYFNAPDLWFSFLGLNRRIDAIIDQTPLDLKLQRCETFAQFVKNIHPSMNAANVRSISLRAPKDVTHFFFFYSLGSFVQLRSLDIGYMFPFNDPKFQAWKPLASFKHLRSLKVTFAQKANYKIAFAQKDFLIRSVFEAGSYPALRRFSVETRNSRKSNPTIPYLNPTTKTINLRYLSIDTLTFGDLVKLLPALGNIKSLCIGADLGIDERPTEIPPKVDTPLLPKCLRLEVKFCDDLMLEHVEYLLQQTPNVECLVLGGWPPLIDAKKWESLLSTLCPKLMKFELVCLGLTADQSFETAMLHFEEECRVASFWLQRGVDTAQVPDDLDEPDPMICFAVVFELTQQVDDS